MLPTSSCNFWSLVDHSFWFFCSLFFLVVWFRANFLNGEIIAGGYYKPSKFLCALLRTLWRNRAKVRWFFFCYPLKVFISIVYLNRWKRIPHTVRLSLYLSRSTIDFQEHISNPNFIVLDISNGAPMWHVRSSIGLSLTRSQVLSLLLRYIL